MRLSMKLAALGALIVTSGMLCDDVEIFNTLDTNIWVHANIKGPAGGSDRLYKDKKEKISPYKSTKISGPTISTLSIWPSKEKDPSGDKIKDEAKKIGLQVKHEDQKFLFVFQEGTKIKAEKHVPVKNEYPDWSKLIFAAEKRGSAESNPWLGSNAASVTAMFNALPKDGIHLHVADPKNLTPEAFDSKKGKVVTQALGEALGIKKRVEGFSHFQGVMRLPTWLKLGQYIVMVAGQYTGDTKTSRPHIFLAKLDGESATNPLKGVGKKDDNKIVADLFKGTVDKNAPYWHPGGIDICGKYLVIPMSQDKFKGQRATNIEFYDISSPEKSRMVYNFKSSRHYGAAALTRLPNDYYLLALLDEEYLDFYLSKSTLLTEGFFGKPTVELTPYVVIEKKAQSINFITAGDGTLFLAATHNKSEAAPVSKGDNVINFYRVNYDLSKMKEINKLNYSGKGLSISPYSVISILKETGHKKECSDDYCNFNAGATLYAISTNKIELLSIYHWVIDNGVRMTAFSK